MEILVFKELTTSDYVDALVSESESWVGLHVDMEDKEQRKFVKDKADEINKLLKKIDRRRIDAAAEFRGQVEDEAALIREKLELANSPFTLLIEAHKAERKKILDAEKARKEAIEAAHQYEIDHEFALLMNDKFDSEKDQREAEQKEREQQLIDNALAREQAKQDAIIAQEKQAEQARLANVEYKASINNEILSVITSMTGMEKEQAKTVIKFIAAGHIPHVTINY